MHHYWHLLIRTSLFWGRIPLSSGKKKIALFCPREEVERKLQVCLIEADGEERGHYGCSTHLIQVLTEVKGTPVPMESHALSRSFPYHANVPMGCDLCMPIRRPWRTPSDYKLACPYGKGLSWRRQETKAEFHRADDLGQEPACLSSLSGRIFRTLHLWESPPWLINHREKLCLWRPGAQASCNLAESDTDNYRLIQWGFYYQVLV